MARKKTVARPQTRTVRELEEELSPEEWELVDFIEEIGPTIARVFIWRIPKHGDHEYIDKVDVSMLKEGAEDYLRDTYGAPCKYFLRFKGSDGRWKFSKTINIGVVDRDAFLNPASNGHTGSHANGQTSNREIELQKELAIMQQRTHETTLALLGNIGKGPAAPDPTAMLTGVVAAFTALKGATTADGGLDFKKLKEIMGVINEFKTPEKEENMFSVVKDLGNKVVETVAGMRQPAALPAAPGQVITINPNPPAPGETNQVSVQQWIKAQLHLLKQKAIQGKEVDAWIDYILDNEEEPGCAAIVYAIKQNVTFEQLLQFDPEIAQDPRLTPWFKVLFDGLTAELNAPADSARPPGNTENPRGNGAASTPGGGDPQGAGDSKAPA